MHEHAARLPRRLVTAEADDAIDRDREFEARIVETSTLAFRVAYSVLRHRQDAEDVAQEAYARAYDRFSQLRDPGRFRAWLVRMAWRAALDRQRANRRRGAREVVGDAPALAQAIDRAAGPSERLDHGALWAAIDALPGKLRLVIVLAGIQGHDVREIAALLGIPEGTVKSRLFVARQRLREALT
jgi:RNA polymerase sigma-70 factor (ECF subfamily)